MKHVLKRLAQVKYYCTVTLAESIIYADIGIGTLVKFNPEARSRRWVPGCKQVTRTTYGRCIGKHHKAKQPVFGDVSAVFTLQVKQRPAR